MGKVFVKGPVESPDDLLAKQAMAQRLQNFKQSMGPALGAGFEHARNYAGTRDYAGAGRKLGTSMGKFANNEIDNFGQFASALADPFFALLGRKPQTPEEEDYARRMIAQQNAQRIEEEMAPQKEEQAYQELYEKYGLSPESVKQTYGRLSPIEALNQEKIVQQGIGRDKRRSDILGEEGGERTQATNTANALVAVGGEKPRPMPKELEEFRQRTNQASMLDRVMGNDDVATETLLEDIGDNYQAPELGGVSGMAVPPPIGNNAPPPQANAPPPDPPSDGAAAQIEEVEAAAHTHNKELGMNDDPDIQGADMIKPPNEESEEETSGFKTPTRTDNSPYGGFGDPMETGINPPTNNINDLKRFGS